MNSRTATFHELPSRVPDLVALTTRTDALCAALAGAASDESALTVVRAWDALRREVDTDRAVLSIRFAQDTRDAEVRARKDAVEAVLPAWAVLERRFASAVLASPRAEAVERAFGAHALACFQNVVEGADARIEADRQRESALGNDYTALQASGRFELDGATLTLTTLRGAMSDADRGRRSRAAHAEEAFFRANGERFDGLFDDLVKLRDAMGRALGHAGFTPLGYTWMRRMDYGPDDVARFRTHVRDHLVPIATKIRARRARDAGLGAPVFHYDEDIAGRAGAPRPRCAQDALYGHATRALAALSPRFGAVADGLRERAMLDLVARDGKAGGGFAEGLGAYGTPFLFHNYVGTAADATVLVHELGHCVQWQHAHTQPLLDFVFPSNDAAEICSLAMELLWLPHAEPVFGDDTAWYRDYQLEAALLFHPYGCAVDEFQHRVYAAPAMTPDERAAAWRDLERAYLPHRRYDAMPHWESGRYWQRQRHIYLSPFYYIDYALASACALQLWSIARTDPDRAVAAYTRLCELGGSLPFRALVAAAGLEDPLATDVLARVARDAAAHLRL